MTANQRRPGFRLPWAPDSDETQADAGAAAPDAVATTHDDAKPETDVTEAPATTSNESATSAPLPTSPLEAEPAATATQEGGDAFMADLVSAMRGVADDARNTSIADVHDRAEEQVRSLESGADERRAALRAKAETDVAGIGEWSEAETARIKKEAEDKVVARRARLDQDLATDEARTEADKKSVRDKVAAYERELEAYHAQLAKINDPSAFAAAAKRLPKAPDLGGPPASMAVAAQVDVPVATPAEASASAESDGAQAAVEAGSDGTPAEVLASRLAQLDATLSSPVTDEPSRADEATDTPSAVGTEAAAEESVGDSAGGAEPAPEPVTAPGASAETAPEASAEAASEAPVETPPAPPVPAAEPAVTEVVVKGLGSFGAITGFRQSLSGVAGIESVALSLGQTGEFVFRATHAAGFDVRAAIRGLEGDGARIEDRAEGGLRVTLERAR